MQLNEILNHTFSIRQFVEINLIFVARNNSFDETKIIRGRVRLRSSRRAEKVGHNLWKIASAAAGNHDGAPKYTVE